MQQAVSKPTSTDIEMQNIPQTEPKRRDVTTNPLLNHETKVVYCSFVALALFIAPPFMLLLTCKLN